MCLLGKFTFSTKDRRQNNGLNIYLLLAFCSFVPLLSAKIDAAAAKEEGECSVRDLATQQKEEPTNVLITWAADSCEDVITYKIFAVQKRYKACGDHVNGTTEGAGDALTSVPTSEFKLFEAGNTSELFFRLRRLNQFSEYEVEVVAVLPGNLTKSSPKLMVSTASGVPETRPEPSGEPSSYSQALKFYWKPPRDCRKQNGRHDGFHLETWGVDPWVMMTNHSIQSLNQGPSVNLIYFQDLLPYTRYKLQVFSLNENGLWNRNMPLEIIARTQAHRPRAPSDIKLLPSKTSVHMQWQPPYPPTGEVDKYVVRVGENASTNNGSTAIVWRHRFDVTASRGSCIKDVADDVDDVGDDSMCWVVTDLKPDMDYIFEIQTWNVNVTDPSEFSFSVTIRTEASGYSVSSPSSSSTDVLQPPPASTSLATAMPRPPPNSSTSRAGEQEAGGGGGGPSENNTLLIVLVLAGAAVVLFVICFTLVYKIKMSRLKLRFELQQQENERQQNNGHPDHRRSSMNSTYLPSSSINTTSTTLASRASSYFRNWSSPQIEEIQSRRLPEPPPNDSMSMKSRTGDATKDDVPSCPVYSDAYNSPEYVDVDSHRRENGGQQQQLYSDIGGYLVPTFHQLEEMDPVGSPRGTSTPKQQQQQQQPGRDLELSSSVMIPVLSYETPRVLDSSSSGNRSHLPAPLPPQQQQQQQLPSLPSLASLPTSSSSPSPDPGPSSLTPVSSMVPLGHGNTLESQPLIENSVQV